MIKSPTSQCLERDPPSPTDPHMHTLATSFRAPPPVIYCPKSRWQSGKSHPHASLLEGSASSATCGPVARPAIAPWVQATRQPPFMSTLTLEEADKFSRIPNFKAHILWLSIVRMIEVPTLSSSNERRPPSNKWWNPSAHFSCSFACAISRNLPEHLHNDVGFRDPLELPSKRCRRRRWRAGAGTVRLDARPTQQLSQSGIPSSLLPSKARRCGEDGRGTPRRK